MKNELFSVYSKQSFSSKEEFLTFLQKESSELMETSSVDIKAALLKRENQGNIEIAPGVLLPHFESSSFIESKVLVFPLKSKIKGWSKDIQKVKLVIVILLKTDEKKSIKQEITKFTRKLADDKYLDKLINVENNK
ncbi:MAG: PTS sugar transporter subunit IIA [Tetragenococcus sp.]|nr:PTS sugar transporter subunit IIA [Tetragenococcus sp.]